MTYLAASFPKAHCLRQSRAQVSQSLSYSHRMPPISAGSDRIERITSAGIGRYQCMTSSVGNIAPLVSFQSNESNSPRSQRLLQRRAGDRNEKEGQDLERKRMARGSLSIRHIQYASDSVSDARWMPILGEEGWDGRKKLANPCCHP